MDWDEALKQKLKALKAKARRRLAKQEAVEVQAKHPDTPPLSWEDAIRRMHRNLRRRALQHNLRNIPPKSAESE